MTIRGTGFAATALGGLALLLGLPAPGASAQDRIAEFYTGKQIRIIVPSAPGGGFDLYARYVGRHLGKHLPGNPGVIVQNMPGAGGLAATNHVYTRASRDGLTLGVLQGPLTYAQVGKSRNVQFDMRKFGWLGSANVTSNTCVFSPRAGIKAGDDLLKKAVIVGASGGSTEFVPNLLNALLETKFKIVKGYKSTSTILPAIESGEVNGLCGWGWDSASVNGRDYFARGIISVGLECANERHPDLAARGVPYMMDLAKSEENKKVLSFLFAYLVYIRPFVAPPEVPAERLKALQNAFAATLKDPEFLAEAKKRGVEIRYASPERVHATLAQIFDAPEAIKARALEELRKAGWEGLRR
ncbi:MAG: Bug family tripartite tricarboxylate transporter substrate binding protein [Xanthobacteraceae bacterium]